MEDVGDLMLIEMHHVLTAEAYRLRPEMSLPTQVVCSATARYLCLAWTELDFCTEYKAVGASDQPWGVFEKLLLHEARCCAEDCIDVT